MGKLYIPAEKDIKGPWLINTEELEELDSVLKEIEILLEESYEKEVEIIVSKKTKDSKIKSENISKNVKSSFSKEIKKNIVLVSKDKSRLIDKSINDLLKDGKIKNFSPIELSVNFEYGYKNTFTLEVSKKYSDRLNYRSRCFDLEKQDEIGYKIEKWLDKKKPNKIIQLWSEFSFPIFWITLVLSFLFAAQILNTELPTTNEFYKNQVDSLIQNGINLENQYQALDLILKYNSNYLPQEITETKKYNPNALKFALIFLFISIIAYFNPKTTIGIGKQKGMVKFYKVYINTVLFTIPGIFIIPPIIDWIKNLI